MQPISIKDVESDQGKVYIVNALKDLVCKCLLEFVDIQIESFMYPDDPKCFTRIFKGNKIVNEASDKDSKVRSYPSSLGVGHSALFPLIYIRQKTNSLQFLNDPKQLPTPLVDDMNAKFKGIIKVYENLIHLYHSYQTVDCNNMNQQKLLGDLVSRGNFMLDILHGYVTIASTIVRDSKDANILIDTVNRFIHDTILFHKRIIHNSNAYTEYHVMKRGMQRNQSEETLVELEFRTLDVSDVNLDNEFDDFLQHRKTSLKITHRRVI
ncbi:ATV_collapsed_G0019000.mRNA.1.CDS.1 [Saccharomyces cerevisiae]|nr:ATV_collapsed_G0019000.mRNA.1.CDS.1 [Saccharomyces cerevisiae]